MEPQLLVPGKGSAETLWSGQLCHERTPDTKRLCRPEADTLTPERPVPSSLCGSLVGSCARQVPCLCPHMLQCWRLSQRAGSQGQGLWEAGCF